jgi:hypothetical protein
MLRVTAIDLVAGIIEQLEEESAERGRPRLSAAEVVATLQFFLREGVQAAAGSRRTAPHDSVQP